MRFNYLVLFCAAFLVSSCGGGGSTPALTSNSIPDTLSPPIIKDINPDLKIVEVNLIAKPAIINFGTRKNVSVFSYNGIVPGPTIEANVGDEIIVHFTNGLLEDTTIHWHGVELPANMDGSSISQRAVASGEKFTYRFTVNRAATYWYHPHERSNIQVERGLHGALIVRDPAEDKLLKLPIKEHVLILDDILMDETDPNLIASDDSGDLFQHALEILNGREGNVFLVNGKVNPRIQMKRGVPNRFRIINAANVTFMRVSVTDQKLWRIGGDAGLIENPIEHYPIRITPAPIVKDGPEYISDQNPDHGILLTPGERAEFIITPNSDSSQISLEWHDIHRGKHSLIKNSAKIIPKDAGHPPAPGDGNGNKSPFTLAHDVLDGYKQHRKIATFELYGDNNVSFYTPPMSLRPVAKINESSVNGAPIKLMYGHTTPDSITGESIFFIKKNPLYNSAFPLELTNLPGLPYPQVTVDIADKVTPNDIRIIEITNLTEADHNFHLHGFMFQLLDTRYIDDTKMSQDPAVPAPFTEFKDTIIVPRRLGAIGSSRSISRLIVKFDDLNREGKIYAEGKVATEDSVTGEKKSGGWIMHCHFLEHSSRGMMSFIQVVP